MKQLTLEEEQLVHLYVAGRLNAEQEAEFEERYLDCPSCQAAVAEAEGLRSGLQHLVAEGTLPIPSEAGTGQHPEAGPAEQPSSHSQHGQQESLGTASNWKRYALPLAALLLLGVGLTWLLMSRQLATARGELRLALEQLAAIEQVASTETSPTSQPARDALLNLPLAFLSPTRSNSLDAGGQAPFRLVPGDATLMILALEIGPIPAAQQSADSAATWNAELVRDGQSALWQGKGLKPSNMETLNLALPTSLLQPGAYRLDVLQEGETGLGTRFHFEVAASPPAAP